MKLFNFKWILMACVAVFSGLLVLPAHSAPQNSNVLKAVKFVPLPNNRVEMTLQFSRAVKKSPPNFLTKHPARVVFDFANVANKLDRQQANQSVGIGALRSFKAIEAGQRTRVVLNLAQVVPYSVRIQGNNVVVMLSSGKVPAGVTAKSRVAKERRAATTHAIRDINFHSNKAGGGKIVVDVSDPHVGIDLRQSGDRILVDFVNSRIPERLQRRLDVRDFATPVQKIETTPTGKNVQMQIFAKGNYKHFAYQVNKQFVVEVKPITQEEEQKAQLLKPHYSGKRISLNFQDIKVRSVLQLLAEFTELNIVVSDSVTGNITLQLNNVPWDQALDIILRTRGLAKRQFGSVILVAPGGEIAAQEKQALQARKQVKELAPLRSELVQVNYAKASDIAKLLKQKGNSLLSKRGNVSVDARTNILWLQDTAEKLEEIRTLVHTLDVPVKQVLIEARIVNVDKTFQRDLGVRFGVTRPTHISGTLTGADDLAGGTAAADVPVTNRLNVDLPAISANSTVGTIGLALAKLNRDILLDLELSALESEGRGRIISSPRLITANQQSALIESGEEIPYQEATSSGATAIAFKKAVLSLQVTPQITPDHKVILTLVVNQDEATTQTFNGVPAIKTKEIQTQVLVDNGETIVLGGIYKQTEKHDVNRIPFLGSLPIVGALFSNKKKTDNREELLIFITPKIVQQSYAKG